MNGMYNSIGRMVRRLALVILTRPLFSLNTFILCYIKIKNSRQELRILIKFFDIRMLLTDFQKIDNSIVD